MSTMTSNPASSSLRPLPPEAVIFGVSEPMQSLRASVEKVAAANVPMLIEGESGTGKDIIARLVHCKSPWQSGPYVKVNCAAIPGTLVESELFGYEKGGFTGAFESKPGRVELAHRGTLFLDEVSELEFTLQSKLLQLLQDGQFCRIGAQEDTQIEVRVVCSSNLRLEEEVNKGRFRPDLLYRINVISLRMPALRQRSADVPILIDYFIDTFNAKYNRRAKPISSQTLDLLMGYSWPGNIRQLENLIKRYVILESGDAIWREIDGSGTSAVSSLPEIAADRPISLKEITRTAVRDLERKVILKTLEANHWNRKRAARMLSISYRALLYKLKGNGVAAARDRARMNEATKD